MNFFIFTFLALCASATTSTIQVENFPRVELLEYHFVSFDESFENFGLLSSINEFIKETIDNANNLIENFNKISQKTEAEVNDDLAESTQIMEDFYLNIDKKIQNLKLKGGYYKNCAELIEPEIKRVRSDGLKNILKCAKAIVSALKDFASEVSKETISLSKNIAELVSIVKDCFDKKGSIAIAKCAFQKIKQVKELISKIVQGIKSTISTVVSKINAIIKAGKSCKSSHTSKTKAKFDEYNAKLMKCYDKFGSDLFYD